MSNSREDAASLAAKQAACRAATGRLHRDGGEGPGGRHAPRRSDAAVFQDLAATGEFTPEELREAIEGMGLARMREEAPADFAALAKEVGADLRGMDGPLAVGEVVRAIMSGAKPGRRKGAGK